MNYKTIKFFLVLLLLAMLFLEGCAPELKTAQPVVVTAQLPPTATAIPAGSPRQPTWTPPPTSPPTFTPQPSATHPTLAPSPTARTITPGDPKKAMLLLLDAQALYKSADYLGAIQIYDQMLTLGVNQELLWGTYELRGDAYHKLKDYSAAIADYSMAVSMGAQDAKVFNNLCWVYSITGHPGLALPYCEKAVTLQPREFHNLDSRGLAYALLGNYPAAADDFQQVVNILANTQVPEYQELRQQRLAWINSLKAGINPLTPSVLAGLPDE